VQASTPEVLVDYVLSTRSVVQLHMSLQRDCKRQLLPHVPFVPVCLEAIFRVPGRARMGLGERNPTQVDA
jgi:hypothetical protein